MVNTRRGQVSLEYLMTYGIAIAIVVIAIAALYSMGVFSPSSSTVACSPCFSNFAFVDYADGNLVIKNGPRGITITNVTDSEGSSVTLTDCTLGTVCDANTQFQISFTPTQAGTTQKINITYSDSLSNLPHSDIATIHN